MNVLEKELEDILFEHIDSFEVLYERGFEHYCQRKYRQVNLGDYGVADIIGINDFESEVHREIVVNIYELKKEEISVTTFLQAIRYAKALKILLENSIKDAEFHYNIILIGKRISISSDFVYLPDFYENLHIYTYKIDFNKGIYFNKEEGYKLTNGKIPIKSDFFFKEPI
ncbi:MAG: hypothetical protein B7Y37_13720 [Sphingobacteriia bacterium 28-36-52]|nr:MAG: hypothetical protein B7Y37_13720 [Sphingobacteriia bacterium 28-36-52]